MAKIEQFDLRDQKLANELQQRKALHIQKLQYYFKFLKLIKAEDLEVKTFSGSNSKVSIKQYNPEMNIVSELIAKYVNYKKIKSVTEAMEIKNEKSPEISAQKLSKSLDPPGQLFGFGLEDNQRVLLHNKQASNSISNKKNNLIERKASI